MKKKNQIKKLREKGYTYKQISDTLKISMNKVANVVRGFKTDGRGYVRHMVRERDKFTCQDCGFKRTPQQVREHNEKCNGLKGRIKILDVHHKEGLCGKYSKGYDRLHEMDLHNRHDRSSKIGKDYNKKSEETALPSD